MAEIHRFEEGIDHITSELICINCKHRFLNLRPLTVWLKDLECPNCKETGYLIETGEVIGTGVYEKVCKDNPEYHIYRRYEQIYQKEDEY